MQLLCKLLVVCSILIFNCFNFVVPYLIIKGVIVISKHTNAKEYTDSFENRNFNQSYGTKSQESPTDTHRGDNKFVNKEIKHFNKNNDVKSVPKRGTTLDSRLDFGFPKNTDFYVSLCFSEELQPGEPLQLVYPNYNHTELLINQEALKALEKIEKPVYPVGIIGSVNSGKSLLINLLNDNYLCSNKLKPKTSVNGFKEKDRSLNRNGNKGVKLDRDSYSKGFKMANTPEPETFGIWLYSEPLKITRRSLEERLKKTADGLNTSYYSLKNLGEKETNQFSKLTRVRSGGVGKVEDSDSDETVNVVFIDIEGFSSHKNIYKYDEAIFSIVSSICSEVIYLTNKTMNMSDLQLVEELIKSSLLSKISNLHTLYTDIGESREDREEIFQYFLKIFENKNLTFLINEFDYASEKAFENLVNLLEAPKRDLSLHEYFVYHSNKNNQIEAKDKSEEGMGRDMSEEGLAKEGSGSRRQSEEYKKASEANQTTEKSNLRPSEGQISGSGGSSRPEGSLNSGLEMEHVMFNRHGYIFHMLFNSVNIATLPSTSKNRLLTSLVLGTRESTTKSKGKNSKEVSDEEYFEHLSRFKTELFQRSTVNPLVKYCVSNGVTSTCHMSGRDLAEMVKFTLNSLSLNRFYKLATSVGTIEGLGNMDYKDAFDEYFKMFRSTRLLMIKNDLYETYRNMLNGYINSGKLKREEVDSHGLNGQKKVKGEELVSKKKMPTISMLKSYSQGLKNQLLDLLVKNYENEAVPEDFSKIKTDLAQGFDRVASLVEEELYVSLKGYCTDAAERLIGEYQRNIDLLKLPVLPSKLKFLHDLPRNFRKQYAVSVDGIEPASEDYEYEGSDRSVRVKEWLLSEDEPCDLVFEHYLESFEKNLGEVFKRNEDLIESHFTEIMNRALRHFRTKFIEVERNYEVPMQESLKLTAGIMKEAHNVMVTHLGEFHAMEYLVGEYKSRLRVSLQGEVELFKRTYTARCLEKFEKMQSHYLDKYLPFLERYSSMPTDPEVLVKHHEYMLYLARSEFYKVSCVGYLEIERKHQRLEAKLNELYKKTLEENVQLVCGALQQEFDKVDEYLMSKVEGSRFYSYFRYNARRYAKFKISHDLIFSKLNLSEEPGSPCDFLALEQVLFDPENAKPTSITCLSTTKLGPNTSMAASFDIDMNELAHKFIRLNTTKIHGSFVNRVVNEYMSRRMPKFKKMFIKRYCNLLVLICSFILLGMSTLSFLLAQNGFGKLGSSLLGFVSYVFLVGFENTKKSLKKLQHLFKNLLKRGLNELLKLFLASLSRLLDLLGYVATFVFMRIGFLYTFLVGFLSALFLYIYYRVRRFRRLCKSKSSK